MLFSNEILFFTVSKLKTFPKSIIKSLSKIMIFLITSAYIKIQQKKESS
jgi:hypothetical protein